MDGLPCPFSCLPSQVFAIGLPVAQWLLVYVSMAYSLLCRRCESHTRVSWSLSSCMYGAIINAYHDQGKTVRDLSLIASCPLADVLNSHHRNSVCSQCAQCLADCRLTLQVSDLVGIEFFPLLVVSVLCELWVDIMPADHVQSSHAKVRLVCGSHISFIKSFGLFTCLKAICYFQIHPTKTICLQEMSHGNVL